MLDVRFPRRSQTKCDSVSQGSWEGHVLEREQRPRSVIPDIHDLSNLSLCISNVWYSFIYFYRSWERERCPKIMPMVNPNGKEKTSMSWDSLLLSVNNQHKLVCRKTIHFLTFHTLEITTWKTFFDLFLSIYIFSIFYNNSHYVFMCVRVCVCVCVCVCDTYIGKIYFTSFNMFDDINFSIS